MLSTKYRQRLEFICDRIAKGEEVKLEDMIWADKLAKANRSAGEMLRRARRKALNPDMPEGGLDDFLNYRKPVLLFDPKHFFSKNINYDSNIVTDNYEDLEKKITFLIDDFEGALLKQKKTKDYLFQDFDKNNYIKLLDNHIFKNIE